MQVKEETVTSSTYAIFILFTLQLQYGGGVLCRDGWCGTSTAHCSGRMLRGNNNMTEVELELELETEVKALGDLIDEPNEPLIQ